MQSPNCIREASKACFNTCCANPNHPNTSPPPAAAEAAAGANPRRDFVSAILSTLHPNTTFTNHESLPSSRELLSSLRDAVPSYLNTVLADNVRSREYHHLTLSNRVCLDYVGHGLFSYAQRHGRADPHAASTSAAPPPPPPDDRFFDFAYVPTSLTSYLLYGGEEPEFHESAKRRILEYMNLSGDDYSLVLTASQPSAFKLLAHSYPFGSRPGLVTVYDHDNEALEPMVEAARRRGGRPQSAAFSWPGLRVDSRKLKKILIGRNRGLLAFPLQSRITGARYSYQWMNLAREHGWHVLLDATALAAKEMETLGLSLFQPDFLICSFFKIFGDNPAGFGCLFVKKSAVSVLDQSSANTGIINLVPAMDGEADHELEQEQKDDGAVEFRGLDHADALGLILISSRLRCLTNWAVHALLSLRHPRAGEGLPLVTVYGPRVRADRGPAVAFNVCDWKGERVEPTLVQKLADRSNISLSVGILKNICFGGDKEKKDCGGDGVGVVSASLGMLTDFEDVYRLWAFVSRFLDADFVEKERWRYTALNQTTVEV